MGPKGFHWGYQNPAYVGASLKENVLVRASLKSDESSKLQFGLNGRQRLGLFEKVKATNLFVGLSRDVPQITSILASW